MKKWLNYLPTIFILSIVLSLVFYSSQGSTVQMNYTQFEKIVDEVDFKKSSMTISSTVIHLEGTYEGALFTIRYVEFKDSWIQGYCSKNRKEY